jgi:transposase-like protein
VIADEHAGLAAAVRKFLPEARRQRCTVHYVEPRIMWISSTDQSLGAGFEHRQSA